MKCPLCRNQIRSMYVQRNNVHFICDVCKTFIVMNKDILENYNDARDYKFPEEEK